MKYVDIMQESWVISGETKTKADSDKPGTKFVENVIVRPHSACNTVKESMSDHKNRRIQNTQGKHKEEVP